MPLCTRDSSSSPPTERHGLHAWQGFPISVAGKTGTAEKLPEDDYVGLPAMRLWTIRRS
jgi:cell division protein FtsI/penicillin-binding protein 2